MKKRILPLLSASLLLVALSSCSLFQKNVKTDTSLPSDRTTVDNGNVRKPYRSQALERGEIAGDWLIETVGGQTVSGQDTPFLKFDPATRMVYGNNGCNTINANYANNAKDSTLTFDNMITTMRLCADQTPSEMVINEAIAATAYYNWTLKDSRYTLRFYNADHKPLMTLARQDFDFLNGSWRVAQIEGVNVKNEDMNLVLDIDEMKIHGNTGCNVLNGSIVTDMAVQGAISFQDLATTRMMCPDINEETTLLVALEAAASVRPVDANTVELLNMHGGVVLKLVRI